MEGDPVTESFSFVVVDPPTGIDMLQTIMVRNNGAENYTVNLSPGD